MAAVPDDAVTTNRPVGTCTGPTVVAVHASPTHDFSKHTRDEIELHEGHGVAGDAHYGATVKHRSRVARDATRPNLRQVHLIHAELFDHLAGRGYRVTPGALGENVTTSGIDLLGLPTGTRLRLGDRAVVTVTGLRNPCHQINGLADGLLKEMVRVTEDGDTQRLAGVMSVVSHSGTVRAGDPIVVELPPEPYHPLAVV